MTSACRTNLYRPINTNVVNLDKIENSYVSKLKSISDTILTLRKSDCQPNSEDYFITIHKLNGKTKSKAFTTYGNYPDEAILLEFNWDSIFNNIENINIEKPKPSFYATVIEGDTTWGPRMSFSGEQVWSLKLYCETTTIDWESVSSDRRNNPSMKKSRVTKYILTETYNKAFGWGDNALYGERELKKLPIFQRRR